jgi:hypothetical protein
MFGADDFEWHWQAIEKILGGEGGLERNELRFPEKVPRHSFRRHFCHNLSSDLGKKVRDSSPR